MELELSNVLSGLAILVSIIAIVVSYRSNKLLNSLSIAKLKKEINRLESADIRISILDKKYYLENGSSDRIVEFQIKNVGNSLAANLNIIDDKWHKYIELYWRFSTPPKPPIPIPMLKHSSIYKFPIWPNTNPLKNTYLSVEWDDINGDHKTEDVYVEIIQSDIVIR